MRLINLWARVAARFFRRETARMNDVQRRNDMEKFCADPMPADVL
jgi:hypothetical protein